MAPQPQGKSRIFARVLAPLALAACALAVVLVVGGALSERESSGGSSTSASDSGQQQQEQTATAPKARRQPATYTIQSGDTLGAIAEETGVPVETLQQLNPEIDPQALIAGQKIKLR